MNTLINIFNSYAGLLNDFCSHPITQLDFIINFERLTTKYLSQDIRFSEDFIEIFNKLSTYNEKPCIYWFDSDKELDGSLIYELINAVSKSLNLVIPAHDNKPHKSSCLYVGKVKSNIQGRLIQHLGVHKDQLRTHGLQLVHWINNYPCRIKLHYHVVPLPQTKEWEKMAMLFEYAFSDELKPVLGHHNG